MNISRYFFLLVLTLLSLPSCSKPYNTYYVVGTNDQKTQIQELLTIASRDSITAQDRFISIKRVSEILVLEKEYQKALHLLTGIHEKFPNDIYSSYYLYLIAFIYEKIDEKEIASIYYDKIIKNYPDLLVNNDESIHHSSLKRLIAICKDPKILLGYYLEIGTRFPDILSESTLFYLIGDAYEKTGEWKLALENYKRYLAAGDIIVPGHPNAFDHAQSMVDQVVMTKKWAVSDIDTLLSILQTAFKQKDIRTIERYRAKINFVLIDWSQKTNTFDKPVIIDFSEIVSSKNIIMSNEKESFSTLTQVWVKSSGWNLYTDIWYLYFRRVNFPADVNIHGKWEWAGIYFGEKN